MAQCAYCHAETEIYYGVIPVCIECSQENDAKREPPPEERQILESLIQDVIETTTRKSAASEAFEIAIGQFPSGLPPDGAQRIKNTSVELSIARKEMIRARDRLDKFRNRGSVAKSFKQSA
jgi:hypothetical protein